MKETSNIKTHFLMLLVAIIWGLSWAIGRILSLEIPPMTGAWLRYILTVLIFYLWFMILKVKGEKIRWLPNNRETYKSLIIIGFYRSFYVINFSLCMECIILLRETLH